LSTQISKEEAAVISAALLAYLGKPAPVLVSVPTKISKEDIQGILDEFGRELKEAILNEFRETVGRLEKRISDLERRLGLLRNRIGEIEKKVLVEKPPTEKVEIKLSWGLASRHEVGGRRDLVKNLSKSASFWSLVSKVEKQLSLPTTCKRKFLGGGFNGSNS